LSEDSRSISLGEILSLIKIKRHTSKMFENVYLEVVVELKGKTLS